MEVVEEQSLHTQSAHDGRDESYFGCLAAVISVRLMVGNHLRGYKLIHTELIHLPPVLRLLGGSSR